METNIGSFEVLSSLRRMSSKQEQNLKKKWKSVWTCIKIRRKPQYSLSSLSYRLSNIGWRTSCRVCSKRRRTSSINWKRKLKKLISTYVLTQHIFICGRKRSWKSQHTKGRTFMKRSKARHKMAENFVEKTLRGLKGNTVGVQIRGPRDISFGW
jgi:hypothetical protein